MPLLTNRFGMFYLKILTQVDLQKIYILIFFHNKLKEFPIILFLADKDQISQSTNYLSNTDDENIDQKKIVLLDTMDLKFICQDKQTKLLQISVPQTIKFQNIAGILKKEIDFALEQSSKIKIDEHQYTYSEIKQKTFIELEIKENMKIYLSNENEKKENLGLLVEEVVNFTNPVTDLAGNLNLETDASTGNADLMHESMKTHTMSTSIIFF